jgi:hypothetical protein
MEEARIRKQLRIPPNAKLTVIDMGEGKVEPKTAGWTDEQILNKSVEDFDSQINSEELAVQKLRDIVAGQEDRLTDLRRIRARRKELGG